MKRDFKEFNSFYQSDYKLDNILDKLIRLNKILKSTIPQYLANVCRIGSIDEEKSIVVLYITNQQARHILRNLHNHILQAFYSNGYNFNQLLIKVSQVDMPRHITTRVISDATREKLKKLAQAIDKPELVR